MFLDDMCILCQTVTTDIKTVSTKDEDGFKIEDKIKYVISTQQNLTSYNTVITFRPKTQKNICIRCIFHINQTYKFKQECQKNLQALSSYIEKIVANLNGIVLPSTIEQTRKLEKGQTEPTLPNRHPETNVKTYPETIEIEDDDEEMTDLFAEDLKPTADIIKDIKNEENSLHHEFIIKDEPLVSEINTNDLNTDNSSQITTEPEPIVPINQQESVPQGYRFMSNKCKVCFRSPTGKNLYKCGQCGKSYHQIQTLISHIRSHRAEKFFVCPVCERGFNRKDGLTMHLERHKRHQTGERPFECEICHKTFILQENLRKHEKLHTADRPYPCELCEKRFFSKFALEIHQRMHTQERPYKCTLCDRSFNQKQHLNGHLRTHTGEKPFKCHICPFTSALRSGASTHMKRVHKIDTAKKRNRFKWAEQNTQNGSETENGSPDLIVLN